MRICNVCTEFNWWRKEEIDYIYQTLMFTVIRVGGVKQNNNVGDVMKQTNSKGHWFVSNQSCAVDEKR